MRGKKPERITLQKMIRYCNEIEQILKKFENIGSNAKIRKRQITCVDCRIRNLTFLFMQADYALFYV